MSLDFLLYHRELSNRDVMVPEAISQTLGWIGSLPERIH
jgi:hypothetical protein